MTIEMQQTLEREMDDALAIEDAERRHDAMLTVLAHQNRSLIDCQRKTADRVKAMIAKDEAEMNQKKGAKWAVGGIVGIASVAGPVVAMKICKAIGLLW